MKKILILLLSLICVAAYAQESKVQTLQVKNPNGSNTVTFSYTVDNSSNDLHVVNWTADWGGGKPFNVQITYVFNKTGKIRAEGDFPLVVFNTDSPGGVPSSGTAYAPLTTPQREPNWAWVTYSGYACTSENQYGDDAICSDLIRQSYQRRRN
jgi:hypothetical protein